MAKLTSMPSMAIIDGFRGAIDFYYWNGIPVARKWPSSPGHQRSPAVMAQWPSFSYAAKEWTRLSYSVREAYNAMAQNSGLSGRDLQLRAYLSGLYRYQIP